MKRVTVLTVAGFALAGNLCAHDEPFGYLRGAQVEAKGEWEVEQWNTARIGKESGSYLGLDFSTELEYGVTDRFQTALYLNTRHNYTKNAVGSAKVFDDRDSFEFDGVATELKYQVASPYTSPLGFALYLEPGYSRISSRSGEFRHELILEFKAILQKNFFDNRLVTVFNYTIEPEWERENGEWETGLEMQWALGAAWQFAPHWFVGLEARLDTEFEHADLGEAEFLTLFLGPTLHYSADEWFATLTVLPQIAGWPDQNGTGGRHLDDREQVEVRLKFGFEF